MVRLHDSRNFYHKLGQGPVFLTREAAEDYAAVIKRKTCSTCDEPISISRALLAT